MAEKAAAGNIFSVSPANHGETIDAATGLTDEVCPDNVDQCDDQTEVVKEITIKPDVEEDQTSSDLENLVDYRLKLVGIEMKKIKLTEVRKKTVSNVL